MLPHPLIKPRFNAVFWGHDLANRIKDGHMQWSLMKGRCYYKLDWFILQKKDEIIYFDSFGVEYLPEEIKEFIGNKNIKANIFRIQASNSIMCGYWK